MGNWLASLPRTSLGWLVIIRIGIGLAMLSNGLNKLGLRIEPGQQPPQSWLNAAGAKNIIDGAIKGPAIDPFYQRFLEGVVAPNIVLFSNLIVIGELLVGLSLTLGLLTRLGGFGGAFLHLNYMLMRGLLVHAGYVDRVFFLVEIVLACTACGYVLGLDGLLRASLPAWLRPLMSPLPTDEVGADPKRRGAVQLA